MLEPHHDPSRWMPDLNLSMIDCERQEKWTRANWVPRTQMASLGQALTKMQQFSFSVVQEKTKGSLSNISLPTAMPVSGDPVRRGRTNRNSALVHYVAAIIISSTTLSFPFYLKDIHRQ